jgi:hypothetical protein
MVQNLDVECARLGQRLAEGDGVNEELVNHALTVLEEQGVYAFFLYLEYLKARRREGANHVSATCAEFLRRVPQGSPLLGGGDVFASLQRLSENLDDLLFARDVLRQALVYGRYHVKARGASTGGRG